MKTARDWVCAWQTRRAHTQNELRERLSKKGYDEADIAEALLWATRYAGQSDDEAAKRIVETRRHRGYGRARISTELEARGIAPASAEQAALAPDNDELSRAEAALRSARKSDPARAATWLARRGFSEDIVTRAVEHIVGRLEE